MIDDFKNGSKPQQQPQPNTEDFIPDLSKNQLTKQKPLTSSVLGNMATQTPSQPEQPLASKPVDESIEFDNENNTPINPTPKSPKTNPVKRVIQKIINWFKNLKTWQKILFILLVVLLLAGIGVGVFALTSKDKPVEIKKTVVVAKKEEPKPTTVANTLTGRQVAPEINKRQVTGVMIENSKDARPQGGLQQAGVVFEAIAEGGITRFLALFQDTDAESIGPVRSVRPYYISWAQGFDAAIAHVGGSPEALQIMRERKLKDMDQSFNPSYFQRVTFRYAPHNVFTSTAQLRNLQDAKGFNTTNFTGFVRAPKTGTPLNPTTAGNISVNISSANYASSYVYNPTANNYARNLAGAPHTDITTKTQITPDVVIVMAVNYSIHSDGIHSVYNTTGGGKVYVFQNGGVTTGTWAKSNHTSQITFTSDAGTPILLNPGQTWITAVSDAAKVTYTP